ncbi:MAG: transporter [Caulobacteraceae bacterium]|nr:transporter [Caulobacteraceae bacterium]
MPLIVLFLVALFSYIDRSLISVLQVPIKTELGLSDAQLGALTGLAFALVYAIAAVPLARVLDRGKRTLIMAIALTVWSLMTAATSLAAGFAALVVCRIGVALGEAVSLPGTHSLFADYYPLQRRGRAFAVWALAAPVGIMLGLSVGGWLGHDLGWRKSFAIVGLSGLVLVPLLLILKEPPRGQFEDGGAAAAREAQPPLKNALLALWRIRSFPPLVCAATLQTFGYGVLTNWDAPFFSRVHHMPLHQLATTVALIIGVGAGAGAMASGPILDVIGRHDKRWYAWAPAISMLLTAPLAIAQFLVGCVQLSIAFGLAAAVAGAFFVVPTNVAVQSMVSPRMRAFTASILLLVPTIIGHGVGPWITGLTSDLLAAHFGLGDQAIRYAASLWVLTSTVGGVILLFIGKGIARDMMARNRPPL